MSTVQLLIDIEMLAHSDYMTGTLNSGIPYLIEASHLYRICCKYMYFMDSMSARQQLANSASCN